MKNICFPTDFSELSLKALPVAIQYARCTGADLHVLHIIKPLPLLNTGENLLEDAHQKAAQIKLNELKESIDCQLANQTVHITSMHGDIAEKICKYNEHSSIDLVIMSSHGYSGLKRVFMGSNTNKLLRKSPVPVFVVNPKTQPKFEFDRVKNVFFPTDFSEHSNQAIDFAVDVAKDNDAVLTLIHVLLDTEELVGVYGDVFSLVGKYGSFGGFLKEERGKAQKKMTELQDKLKLDYPNLEVHEMILQGDSAEAIVEQCQYDFESLIVMSTHGYSGLTHALLGSVTENVIQMSPVPVIAYRPFIENENKLAQSNSGEEN